MRLRNKKEALPTLLASERTLNENKEKLNSLLNKKPLYVEIGMGKGNFIIAHAQAHPNIEYIGIEKFPSVQWIALKKLNKMEQQPTNLHFISMDVEKVFDYFPKHSVDLIYINHPDPWPKKRHLKKRLTYTKFLNLYYDLLKENGVIKLRTDQKPFFDSTIEQLEENKKFNYTIDEDYILTIPNHIQTEYETKFRALGNPIYFLTITKKH